MGDGVLIACCRLSFMRRFLDKLGMTITGCCSSVLRSSCPFCLSIVSLKQNHQPRVGLVVIVFESKLLAKLQALSRS